METTLSKKSWLHLSGKTKGIIVDVIVYLFVLLFVYTAASKFMTMKGFETILSRSPVTGPYSQFLAWGVPSIEIIISLFLLLPRWKKLGLISALVLMVLFTAFLTYGILSGSQLPCHCGGVISSMTWKEHIFFNGGLIILAITALALCKK